MYKVVLKIISAYILERFVLQVLQDGYQNMFHLSKEYKKLSGSIQLRGGRPGEDVSFMKSLRNQAE